MEFGDVGEPWRRRKIVLGAQGQHQIISLKLALVRCDAAFRRINRGDGLLQHSHAGLGEVLVGQAHRMRLGMAEHHVELGEAENEMIALVDQCEFDGIAERFGQ
jgi:hypothetical protein